MSTLVFEQKLPCGIFQVWDDKPAFDCFHVHQVHGCDFLTEKDSAQADGIYGVQTMPWAIKTADCMPVVVVGQKGCVFFHAGWRGLAAAIYQRPQVRAIMPFYAFIGPHISAKNFEVGEDFHQHFPRSRHFMPHHSGKECFDLLRELSAGLQVTYRGITVEHSGLCTYEIPWLNSYRRDQTTRRNWNVLKLEI